MADWTLNGGGGEYNSDTGDTVPSQDRARTGAWSYRSTITGTRGGTRLFRWAEARANRNAFYEVWAYFPTVYDVPGNYWNVFQFKTRDTAGRNDPFWFLDIDNIGGQMVPTLVWWPTGSLTSGPHQGESGFRRYQPLNGATIPAGRWVNIRAQLVQSNTFTGAVRFWLDGVLIHDQTNVKTGWPNCTYNSWCVANEWAVNNYSDGLSPLPATIYFDDAAIAVP